MNDQVQACYYNTEEPVKLGDRVEIKRFFGKPYHGVVIYIPGLSKPHPQMEFGGLKHWAVQLDDDTLISWVIMPDEKYVGKKIRLLSRGHKYKPLEPDEELP